MSKQKFVRLGTELLEDRAVPALIDLTGIEFRTITGINNNQTLTPVNLTTQGAAETRQIRFGYGVEFADNDPTDIGNVLVGPLTTPSRPSPRVISNVIHDQGANSLVNDRRLTDFAFQWGQWITHDIDLTRTGAAFDVLLDANFVPIGPNQLGDYRIPVPAGDPDFDPSGTGTVFIPFNRSEVDFTSADTEVGGQRPPRRHQINSITSYIDASMVYGSDMARQAALRTGQGGLLKTSANGQLLPLWDPASGLPNADALNLRGQLFLAGDVRANEQVNLTVMHTLFVREHNRLATRIAQLNPGMIDEQIYQTARRIVGAEMQVITYKEYLPATFGYDLAPDPDDAVYSATVNASATNSFAHAAFRFGHSQINNVTLLVNNFNQTVGSLSVANAFFNPNFLKNDPDNVGRMLKGLASQLGQENDLLLVDGIRNTLFGPPGAGGLDLAALDIQRGRDHGLPDYNNLRNAYGVGSVTSFAQISSNPAIQAKLLQLFGNVDNIDPFVGMLAEDHLPGTSTGPLIHAIVTNQFERLRDGDRFFYSNDAFLDSAGIRDVIDIGNVTLSQIIKWNTGIFNIQDNVFFDRSVIVIEVPEAGSNLSVVAALGVVTVVNNRNGHILAVNLLSNVSQVILVGSDSAADFFNLFISAANGGLEGGVVAYGGNSAGDKLNVYGTPLIHDTFTVADNTFTTGAVTTAGVDTTRTVTGRTIGVNGNGIFSTGFETTRLVKLGGNDTIIDPGLLAIVVDIWNPLNEG